MKLVALGLQRLLQRFVVFDDTIVGQRQNAIATDVRVGVLLGSWTMGGPACVTNSSRGQHGAGGHGLFKLVHSACHARDANPFLRADSCYAGAVITAVFQASQSANQERAGLLGADVADNSAHREYSNGVSEKEHR